MSLDPNDPADQVRAVLERAGASMSVEQIAAELGEDAPHRVVEEALDFWRREHGAVVETDDGTWIWRGTLAGEA